MTIKRRCPYCGDSDIGDWCGEPAKEAGSPAHLNAVKIAERKTRDRAEEIRAGIVDDGFDDGPDPWGEDLEGDR